MRSIPAARYDQPVQERANHEYVELLRKYWGFDTLRPLQARAVECGLERRDSLVVMPTGGGKSLCFQLPPLVNQTLSVVVSPLIALMKDQVDGLVMSGYPAACLNSHTTAEEASAIARKAEEGMLRLLYVAPERLFTERFIAWLRRVNPGSFAIDEAHCISAWGHDFRPEYRRLSELRSRFPLASIHAFTATATPRVREDIAHQLALREPEILVGVFDRPNLTYRVMPRTDSLRQVMEAIKRHPTSASIVYCISRKETEQLAASLRAAKVHASAYHAGLGPGERRRVQDEFAQERLNVVVATVAFGMGIDRSDVRCVVHTAHPKSVEAYQQETGRAGRDGLPADCLLLYSGSDTSKWVNLIERSAAESDAEVSAEWIEHSIAHVRAMQRFCQSTRCRHQMLSEYFGQNYTPARPATGGVGMAGEGSATFGCGACDVCLGELELDPLSLVTAQKIVSCVARIAALNSDSYRPIEFGAAHIAQVLVGSRSKQVIERGHEELTTFGLLRDLDRSLITSYINQLVDAGALVRSAGTFPTISLGERARGVLRGEFDPGLRRAAAAAKPTSKTRSSADAPAMDPLAAELFEELRGLRRSIAQERVVPAYMIFGDRTLHALAERRPISIQGFRAIPGVGDRKAREFGERFVDQIVLFCGRHGVSGDPGATAAPLDPEPVEDVDLAPVRRPASRDHLDRLWEQGASIEEACEETKLKPSTVTKYLQEYIEERLAKRLADEPVLDVSPWVDTKTYAAIIDAASKTGADRFKPIYEFLGEQISYEQIRIALTHDRALRGG